MKKYTQEDLNGFKIDECGNTLCPTGDYTDIGFFGFVCIFEPGCIFRAETWFQRYSTFRAGCIFGDNCFFWGMCEFGEGCTFGGHCHFEDGCKFDNHCVFKQRCMFSELCSFRDDCTFGDNCEFGENCSVGTWCTFRNNCVFGESFKFGSLCRFGDNTRITKIADIITRFIKIDYIGSRKDCAYFYKTGSGIYVHCGCFFGTINEFKTAVKKTHKNNKQYKKEYLSTIKYIKSVF